jgi:hypothetical protein
MSHTLGNINRELCGNSVSFVECVLKLWYRSILPSHDLHSFYQEGSEIQTHRYEIRLITFET